MLSSAPTANQFFETFARYNQDVWPVQLIMVALALICIAFAMQQKAAVPLVALALMWAWAGVVYHIVYFSEVSPVAYGFGALFLTQAALFAHAAWRRRISIIVGRDARGVGGALIAAYALAGYPLVGIIAGHSYPAAPVFSVPCPVAIFTFGLMLWVREPIPYRLLIIPALWSIIAGYGAFLWGVPQDIALPLAAAASIAVAVFSNRESFTARAQDVTVAAPSVSSALQRLTARRR